MDGSRETARKIGPPLLVLAVVVLSVPDGAPAFPGREEPRRLKPAGVLCLEDAGPGIDAGTAIIEFRLGERESRAVILRGRESREIILPSREAIEGSVNGFIRAVGRSAENPEAVCRAARRIAAEILPFEPELAGLGVDRLIIVPDGILGRLAFEALRTSGGAEEAWLIDKYALSYAPSAVLFEKSRRKTPPQGTRLLALGASGLRSEPTGARSGRSIGFLDSVHREVRAVGRLFPRKKRCLYLDGEAGKANFRRHRDEGFQVVHIAAHGRRSGRPAASTRLLLSAGGGDELRTEDIRGCGISADLVVLSACETACGFDSLPRAFLEEGARSVIATLWPVSDRTTADFMSDFYGYLKTGLSKSASLRSAKRGMIRRGRSHPFYWAGYVLFGEPDGKIAFP